MVANKNHFWFFSPITPEKFFFFTCNLEFRVFTCDLVKGFRLFINLHNSLIFQQN